MTTVTRKPNRNFGNHVLRSTDHGLLITVSSSRPGRGGGVGRNLGVGVGPRGGWTSSEPMSMRPLNMRTSRGLRSRQAGFVCQLEQQFDGLINGAVFRVVEKQTCCLDGHALAAFRRGENLISSRNLLTKRATIPDERAFELFGYASKDCRRA